MRIHGLALVLCCTLVPAARGEDKAGADKVVVRPEFLTGKIAISKETTRILGPLDADGRVDYEAAFNAHFGVTPENNAVVKLFEASGPGSISADCRARYFKLLGIAPLPIEGRYVVSAVEFAKTLGKYDQSTWDAWAAKNYIPALERPWTAKEFPFVEAWLKANEVSLSRIHEAAGRSRYYAPWVKSAPGVPLSTVMLSDSAPLVRCRDLLIARSMLHLGAGQVQEAWADILACHRLARLAGQGLTLVHQLVASNLNGVACKATAVLARDGKLSPEQAGRCLADLDALPPLPRLRDCLDVAERCMFLDSVSRVARFPAEFDRCVRLVNHPADGDAKTTALDKNAAANWVQNETVDWDEVMHDGNRWFDLLVDAAQRPSWREASYRFWMMDKKLTEELDQVAGGGIARQTAQMNLFLGRIDPKVSSLQMFEIMAGLLTPRDRTACYRQFREETHFQLARLSLGLAAYRAGHDGYPAKLAELTPRDVKTLPNDPFSTGTFIYRRQPSGYLLYSVGWNGDDDGGRDEDSEPEGDDIVFCVPPRPPVQHKPPPPRDPIRDLIAQLHDAAPAKRAAAAQALGELKVKPADAIGPLIALLGDTAATNEFGPTTPSAAAGLALGAFGAPAVEPLTRALDDRNPTVRAMALIALGGIDDPRVLAPMLKGFKDEDAKVRCVAVAEAAGNKDPRVQEAVVAAVADRDSGVRSEALRVLGLRPDPKATIILLAGLSDKDSVVRRQAAMSLEGHARGGRKELQAVKPLLSALKDGDADVRSAAAGALGAIGDRQAGDALIAALGDKAPEVRVAAALALGALTDRRAVEPLIGLLDDKSTQVQDAAANALGDIGDRRALEPLLPVVGSASRNLLVRIAAARSVGAFADRRATGPLLDALKSSETGLQLAAIESLGKTSDPAAVLPLVAALQDNSLLLRATAADALGTLKDPRALDGLKALLSDPEEIVRSAAKKAIDAIRSSGKDDTKGIDQGKR